MHLTVFHISDLHYSVKTLEEVDRCVAYAVGVAIAEGCDLAVISGDLIDHRIELHAPPVAALLAQVARLAAHMPVLILQGTFSHDAPGSLDVFRTLGGACPVWVADRIGQAALLRDDAGRCRFVGSVGADLDIEALVNRSPSDTVRALISCLPPVNKASVLSATRAEDVGREAGTLIAELLRGWSVPHGLARAHGIPTLLVSHGTVHHAITEHGVPMAGLDHEYSSMTLFAAEASAVLLGHIHRRQSWHQDGRLIAYPGSPARLHFGEAAPKGFLFWTIEAARSDCRFHETPARVLLDLDSDGPPDLGRIARAAADLTPGTCVRVRYTVAEDSRAAVDRGGIERLFREAGAGEIKIEARIVPIERSRSAGINRLSSLAERLAVWCDATGAPAAALVRRLADLEALDTERLIQDAAGPEALNPSTTTPELP